MTTPNPREQLIEAARANRCPECHEHLDEPHPDCHGSHTQPARHGTARDVGRPLARAREGRSAEFCASRAWDTPVDVSQLSALSRDSLPDDPRDIAAWAREKARTRRRNATPSLAQLDARIARVRAAQGLTNATDTQPDNVKDDR